ncbi:hypothetical protein AYO47_00005 [Planctomyces sp. SCGC AG-212-M04]|nr:hypothetical protein AYO47_00005 [Planctomyces sp. SCGC AG-212-M04]
MIVASHAASNAHFLYLLWDQPWPGNNKAIFATFVGFESVAALRCSLLPAEHPVMFGGPEKPFSAQDQFNPSRAHCR